MRKTITTSILLFLIVCTTVMAQTIGTMTDSRDGQTYKTVIYNVKQSGGGTYQMTWLADNMNYKISDSYAYDNREEFRNGYGLLYTWEAAKNACPSGWHLPSDEEWGILLNEFGGEDEAGEVLKSKIIWIQEGIGTNSSGFNALPGGLRYPDGRFNLIGMNGHWWSTKAGSPGKAWGRRLTYSNSKMPNFVDYVGTATSCRCIQN